MKKSTFMDKYPVYTYELLKSEIQQTKSDEIIGHFKSKIKEHPIAEFIAVFDHYAHTKNLGGEINPDIKDAKNLVFCFGPAIPNTKVIAVRPRSIGIAELEDRFIIEFMEAPKEEIHTIMEKWTKELDNKT